MDGDLGERDYFDDWLTRYGEFYPPGSRLDREFRTSRLLVLAGRTWTRRIDNRLREETGQTRARWQALFALGFAEQPVTMGEICRRVRVQWPTMVRVIDEMDRDGLIRREGNPDDKRSKLLYLTPRGEELIARIQPILDQERSEVLSLLNDDELRTCAELLEKIFVASLSGSPPNQAQGR